MLIIKNQTHVHTWDEIINFKKGQRSFVLLPYKATPKHLSRPIFCFNSEMEGETVTHLNAQFGKFNKINMPLKLESFELPDSQELHVFCV